MMLTSREKKLRWARTVNLFLGFFGLGLAFSITGPTLQDLVEKFQTTTERITLVLTCRASGYLIGSLLGGQLFDRFNTQVLVIISLLVMSLHMIIVPWFKTLWPALVVMFIGGTSMGAYDTGGGVWLLNLWEDASGPYMQALHFFFGLGAFVAPLIAEPFLSPERTNITNATGLDLENVDAPDGLYSEYSYGIVGVHVIVVLVIAVVLYIFDKADSKPKKQSEQQKPFGADRKFTILIAALTALLITVYDGVELILGQLLPIFAVKSNLKMSKSSASFLVSAFWGAFTAGRGLAVPVALKLGPITMLTLNFGIILVSVILLAFFADTVPAILWICVVSLGIGLAPIFPTSILFAKKLIVITNRIMSSFAVSTAAFAITIPYIVGRQLDENPMSAMYACLSIAILDVAIFLFMWFISKRKYKSVSQHEPEDDKL